MPQIEELIREVELHDSTISSLLVLGNGSVRLELDIDDVWNKQVPALPKGLLLHSVYEISEFKIDRLNIIGAVKVQSIKSYERDFVTHCRDASNDATLLAIEFVAGGTLHIICSGEAEFYF